MTPPPTRRRATLLLFLALGALVAALLLPTGAQAGDDPLPAERAEVARSVTVSQTTNLERGQVVTVSWEGYTPNERVYLHQCKKGSTSWLGCAEVSRVEGVSDDTGAGSVEFPVWGGALPRVSGIFGSGNQQVACNGTACDLVVSECPFDVAPAWTNVVNLGLTAMGTNPTTTTSSTTSTTTTTLPVAEPAERVEITGGGSSELEDLLSDWQAAVLNDPYFINWDQTVTNSPSGLTGFIQGTNDFAITSIRLDDLQEAQLEELGRTVAYVPIAVGMETLATQWEVNGIPLKELQLSAPTLAKVYQGDLTLFFEQDFTDDNDGCAFPVGGRGPRAGFRTDQSGANLAFSTWLESASDGIWELGAQPIIPIESSLVTGRTGAYALAEWIALGGNQNYNEAYLGFFDSSWARLFGLMPIRIRNEAGQWVTPNREGAKVALAEAEPDDEGFYTLDRASDTPDLYPLTVVYYAAVSPELLSNFPQEQADALAEALTFAVSEEGQAIAAERGFVPLPPELHEQALAAIARLPGQTPTTTTTTTSTTTTTTPPATVATTVPMVPTTPYVPVELPPLGPPITTNGDSFVPATPAFVDTTPPTAPPTTEADRGDDEAAAPAAESEDTSVLARALADPTSGPALPVLLVVGLLALAVGPLMRFIGGRSGI